MVFLILFFVLRFILENSRADNNGCCSPKSQKWISSLLCSAFGRMIMTAIKIAFSEHSSVYLLVLSVFHHFWDL
jgi:hypothetical protein